MAAQGFLARVFKYAEVSQVGVRKTLPAESTAQHIKGQCFQGLLRRSLKLEPGVWGRKRGMSRKDKLLRALK